MFSLFHISAERERDMGIFLRKFHIVFFNIQGVPQGDRTKIHTQPRGLLRDLGRLIRKSNKVQTFKNIE